MARDVNDESLRRHRDWIGFLQPVGLVVSPPALVAADCHVNADVAESFQTFSALVEDGQSIPRIYDLCTKVFGWKSTDLVPPVDPRLQSLEVVLTDYHETLRPSYAVPDDNGWLMLIQEIPRGASFDDVADGDSRHWQVAPQIRFERLLRENKIPTGILFNQTHLRLVYAPRGESTGHVTFPIEVMLEASARPVFAAMVMLLGEYRLFSAPDGRRLPDVLAESRKYQNTVSTELAGQVLAALFELLRGYQAADDKTRGELLRAVLANEPDEVYAGLLTVLLRLVFLLYAEDRGLMSNDEVYVQHYSMTGLFERLRADAGRHPDTMDLRYGAWAQLLSVFRIAYDGAQHGAFRLPARHGYLFDPDRYPFLEGRPRHSQRIPKERIKPPAVSDGVVFRVLNNLLILDGERISYRSLDVEQIGSVYEAIMGYRLEKASGRSIALKPKKAHGAPITINLDALLAQKPADRAKWLKEHADQAPEGKAGTSLKDAKTIEDLVAALERRVARSLTPNIVPPESMVLQPSDERRRSGSHYTPRSLTEPIVRRAFEPIFLQLGESPKPQQILNLKVCDPAMGSGAFLVEACRQLGDALVRSWTVHGGMPKVPDDETPDLLAMRTVAQRCLYGVDKNPMAVALAKLSLWLATLAKDHPFTFLDHSLRCGDSLVGLSRKQITEFHWKPCPQRAFGQDIIEDRLKAATASRAAILEADEFTPHTLKEQKLALADESLNLVRFAGNLVVASFFAADKDKARESKRDETLAALTEFLRTGNMNLRPTKLETNLLTGERPIEPFHWEIEFPEVFCKKENGFDCFVGNPPFLGGTRISTEQGMNYFEWLTRLFPPAGHLCDLVAYFFRRAFSILGTSGTIGFVATNTISQGDTREGGLAAIVKEGGEIYDTTKRLRWPGMAAVVVSTIHLAKRCNVNLKQIDDKAVKWISSFLWPNSHVEASPERLGTNPYFSLGSKIYGQGFIFDDNDDDANPTSEMAVILANEPISKGRILPYIGGEELNSSPMLSHARHVIYVSDIESEEDLKAFPMLMEVIRRKVKPERDKLGSNPNNTPLKKRWWAYQAHRPELYNQIKGTGRALANSQVSPHLAFAFLPEGMVYSQKLCVFAIASYSAFAAMQSRVHEVWARFFASTLKDDLNYTPSDCFETFPFPSDCKGDVKRENVGHEYYDFRAALMVKHNEGLTKTYNRFHDPNETNPDILKLRDLHDQMDRAVLQAYGPPFSDLVVPKCEFLLDYEDEDDEDETPGKRQRKKPWRYRWPDAFRDEVLALLLELNKQRAEEEKRQAPAAKAKAKRGKRQTEENSIGDLFKE